MPKDIFFIALWFRSYEIWSMRFAAALMVVLLSVGDIWATEYRPFSIGIGPSYTGLIGGVPPWFTLSMGYAVKFDTHLKGPWRLELGFAACRIYDDSSAHSQFKLGPTKQFRSRLWKAHNLSLLFKRIAPLFGEKIYINGGLGGGISIWKMTDPNADTVLKAIGERGETTDFTAAEIWLRSTCGLEYILTERWKLGLSCDAGYLTGAGMEFQKKFENSRGPWILSIGLTLSCQFGESKWKSHVDRDRDAAHIIDRRPRSESDSTEIDISESEVEKPVRNIVNIISPQFSCLNGIVDLRRLIDIHGCPIDADGDAFPDYADDCTHNPVGALVDRSGCPIDGDHDGVFDGLDLCPDSDSGLAVNRFGCIDLTIFEKPMIIKIRYQPGSFDIDSNSKTRLTEIAQILLKGIGVQLEINGFANDEETAELNLGLSQRRANRVRDFLVDMGIENARMKPIGRGTADLNEMMKIDDRAKKTGHIKLIFLNND
jgi:hypothetical protein